MAWSASVSQLKCKRPICLGIRSSKAFIMFMIIFAIFTDSILFGLVIPVVPTALRERVGITGDQQKWTSILAALYGAATLVVSPITGYLTDRVQLRRWPLYMGLVTLTSATALLCVGTNLALWIVGRLLQGASSGIIWTAGMTLMEDNIAKEEVGQAIGYAGMAMSFGFLAGPLLGGALYERGGYYAVFGFSFGLIGVDIILRVSTIEKKEVPQWIESAESDTPSPHEEYEKSHDGDIQPPPPQQSTKPPFESSTKLEAIPEIPHKPQPPVQRQPNIFLALFTSPRLLVAIWTSMVGALLMASFDSVLPLFAQDTFSWKQTGQGLLSLPITLAFAASPLVGAFIDHYRPLRRYLVTFATAAAIPALVCLRTVTENTLRQKVLLCALLAIVGVCLSVLETFAFMEVSQCIQDIGDSCPGLFGKGGATAFGYGVANAAYYTGSVVGPFFAGFIRDEAGWATMGWALAVPVGVTGVLVFSVIR